MIATGSPSGAMNKWQRRIFTDTGNKIAVANGTKKPVIRARPHTNSTIFISGKRYPEAAMPSVNVLRGPAGISGCSTRLNNTTAPETAIRRPRRMRTVIVAIFIIVDMFMFG